MKGRLSNAAEYPSKTPGCSSFYKSMAGEAKGRLSNTIECSGKTLGGAGFYKSMAG